MIVVAGEALVDLVISPEGAVTAALGGGPFNTARTIGRLGSPVAYLGSVATDRFGGLLMAALAADGVDLSLVQRPDLPTTLAAAELDEHGAAEYRFYFAGTSAPQLVPVALPSECTVLHAGTLGLVLEPMATVLTALVATAPADVLVVLDPNCRPRIIPQHGEYLDRLLALTRRADVVKVSTDDLEYLSPGRPLAARQALLDAGASVVLHTDGASAVHVCTAGSTFAVEVPRVTVVDTIGAGDSFGGAFVAWWSQAGFGRDALGDQVALRAATLAAVEVSAINCTRSGAQPPRRDELGTAWRPINTGVDN